MEKTMMNTMIMEDLVGMITDQMPDVRVEHELGSCRLEFTIKTCIAQRTFAVLLEDLGVWGIGVNLLPYKLEEPNNTNPITGPVRSILRVVENRNDYNEFVRKCGFPALMLK
jgi:hypothetical protein